MLLVLDFWTRLVSFLSAFEQVPYWEVLLPVIRFRNRDGATSYIFLALESW